MRARETERRRRGSRLVCQHLENVSRKALERYARIIRGYAKGRDGVYALYRRNRLHYVGLASNLAGRLATHLRDRHRGTWDRFSIYLTTGDRHLRELESLLVRIADPRGNRQRGNFARSQDLRPAFRTRIRQAQRREMEEVLLGSRSFDAAPRRTTPVERSTRRSSRSDAARKAWRTRRGGKQRRRPLAPYVDKSFPVRLYYKGDWYRARVRADGTIRYRGKLYTSPSSAAAAIRAGNPAGWLRWQYQRAPGEWVPLDELRRSRKEDSK